MLQVILDDHSQYPEGTIESFVGQRWASSAPPAESETRPSEIGFQESLARLFPGCPP